MIQRTFNEKGFEVARGFRNTKVYRAASCDLLLVINPNNMEEAIHEFRRSEFAYYSGIRVENISNLEFLSEFPLLLYLEVISDTSIDVNPIESLHNIRGLHVSEPKKGLDFSNFPNLEVFTGKWHENNKSIENCRDLRTLMITNYNSKTKDFSDLRSIARLEDLRIIRTNIESLSGIETLKDLKYLMIAYASRLKDISSIGKTNLREIEFDNIKKIQDYNSFGDLEYLRKIILSKCANIENINWIRILKNLDFFSFVDTNVIDGNLSPLLELQELRYVGSFDKKHYNLKIEELNKHLSEVHQQKHF